MEITHIGHSSFRIKTKTAVIITDPFDPKIVGLKFPPTSADIVTISHSHDDHNKKELVKDAKRVVDGPGEYEIQSVSIIGIPSFHDDEKGNLRGKNTIYVFEAERIRLCHLGDLGHKLKEDQINQIGAIDILMIPVGGEFTIGPAEAVETIHALSPKVIIPMHYKQSGMSETFSKIAPVEDFVTALELKPNNLPKLSVKEIDLISKEQELVIL
jgi:L-ascorbate metabolism protein UlaG (beta-lactamase superfamily)